MHALPSKRSPFATWTTTPPASPSPPKCSTFFTTISRRISNPAARASVIWPYPPLTMQCGPPNPPYGSSWFQCAMDIFERARSTRTRGWPSATPATLLSRAVSVTFSLFSPSSSPSPAPSAAAVPPATGPRSRRTPAPARPRSPPPETSSRWRRRLPIHPKPRAIHQRVPVPLHPGVQLIAHELAGDAVVQRELVPERLEPRRAARRSWRTDRLGRRATAIPFAAASAAHPVMMDAPMSTGTDRDELSVCTRPPTRSRASRTTQACPCDVSMRAAARPAGPAPTMITGFVGLGLAASISALALATAALALAASSRLSSRPYPYRRPLYLSGSSRNPVTMARTTSFFSVRSAPSSASIALRICFSVVVFMSAVRRYATVRSVRSSSVIVVGGLASSGSALGRRFGLGRRGLGRRHVDRAVVDGAVLLEPGVRFPREVGGVRGHRREASLDRQRGARVFLPHLEHVVPANGDESAKGRTVRYRGRRVGSEGAFPRPDRRWDDGEIAVRDGARSRLDGTGESRDAHLTLRYCASSRRRLW